jgi:hypothetical protein
MPAWLVRDPPSSITAHTNLCAPVLLSWPQGVFLGAAVSAAMALLAPQSPLPHLLGVFFKEDLLSAVNRRGKPPSLMTNDKLKGMVAGNIAKVGGWGLAMWGRDPYLGLGVG